MIHSHDNSFTNIRQSHYSKLNNKIRNIREENYIWAFYIQLFLNWSKIIKSWTNFIDWRVYIQNAWGLAIEWYLRQLQIYPIVYLVYSKVVGNIFCEK